MKNYRMPLIGGNYVTSGRQKYFFFHYPNFLDYFLSCISSWQYWTLKKEKRARERKRERERRGKSQPSITDLFEGGISWPNKTVNLVLLLWIKQTNKLYYRTIWKSIRDFWRIFLCYSLFASSGFLNYAQNIIWKPKICK